MKKIIRLLVPPIIWMCLNKIKTSLFKKEEELFDGDYPMFVEHVKNCEHYAEYGMGISTNWVFKNTNATIHAVDTSSFWVETVKKNIGNIDRVSLSWINVGELKDWGRPVDLTKRDQFIKYISHFWSLEKKFDLILIDGRFRVACFLYSLLNAKPGAKIIFDDYNFKPIYHVVEDFIKPSQKSQRQALFIVPDQIDRVAVQKEFERFIYIID